MSDEEMLSMRATFNLLYEKSCQRLHDSNDIRVANALMVRVPTLPRSPNANATHTSSSPLRPSAR